MKLKFWLWLKNLLPPKSEPESLPEPEESAARSALVAPLPNGRKDVLEAVAAPQGMRLDRKKILAVVFCALGVFAVAFMNYVQDQTPHEKQNQKDNSITQDTSALKDLPDSYETAKKAETNETESARQKPPEPKRSNIGARVPAPAVPRMPVYSAARESDPQKQKDDQLVEKSLSSKIAALTNFKAEEPPAPVKEANASSVPSSGPNGQDSKTNFLQSGQIGFYSGYAVEKAKSRYELKAGTLIPCLLQTGINSDLPGMATAKVSQNVYDTATGSLLLIPQGTTVIGKYDSNVGYGQNRVLLVWQRLIFPDGSSVGMENMTGVDVSGYAGLRDGVDRHTPDLVRGVVLSSVLAAVSSIATGSGGNDESYGAEAGRGAAESILELGNEMTQSNLKRQPTLTVRPGYRFNILVHQDMILK